MYNVNLEVFQGPLDLLLHLIEKMEIDIYNIPIAQLTESYLEYINNSDEFSLENAEEYIVMAATLLHIKSESIEVEARVEDLRIPSSKLLRAMENILRSLEDIEDEVSLISYRREVSFEQVKEELKDKFKNKGNISFFELIKSYSQKNEVVLVFMGILAMIKDQELLCVDKDSGIILEYKSKEN